MTIRAGEVFRVRVEVYTAATSVAIAKLKTDQILVVDRDGPLPFAVALKLVKFISGRHSQVIYCLAV
jgi:hypothetical protein